MKYKNRYRVIVEGGTPDFLFYAPNRSAAKFYTEMCGFVMKEVKLEKN